ncbi:gephyrin-like molybdotransferase Glp [Fluviibacterium sp. S390]|uniref:molybdopterin molybdotransferase MoeA n=1 Tax=Fluviibacterium sp. S390 TaxID=3415139 RepID=UPI003C79D0CD
MISVSEALTGIFDLLTPLPAETVSLRAASGRVLAEDAVAGRDQPPFDAAVMDGYAVAEAGSLVGKTLRVVGEAAAGHALDLRIGPGEAARIFTGAPMPPGACRVIMQEDTRAEGGTVAIVEDDPENIFVRPLGSDFRSGDHLKAGRRLTPMDVVLLAAMNLAEVRVTRPPTVAILSTGDELVLPGDTPRADQIIASNGFGLAALAEQAGAEARLLPVVRDRMEALEAAFDLCSGADLIVTSGGASVGDHDLLGRDLSALGLTRNFYKVAMRPGKPLMAGKLRGTPMIGLPGNPVSSMVCGMIFMQPALHALAGLPPQPSRRDRLQLAVDLPENGGREHYMRSRLGPEGVTPFTSQDSSLQKVMSEADALIVRPPHDPARKAGEYIETVPLRP